MIANFSGAIATKKYSFEMADYFKVHGSCKGVLLISFHEHLYLCNPMTRHWARFDYVHIPGDMLCLYLHSGTNDYRILRKSARRYSVIELDPERTLLTHRQVCEGKSEFVFDPAPVQVGTKVYWVHFQNGGFAISVFDATTETMDSIPAPRLTESMISAIKVLDVNGQLAASVSCYQTHPYDEP